MVGVYSFFDSANNVTKLVNELVKDENLNEVKYVAEVYLKLDTILKGFPKIRKAFDKVTGQTSEDEAEAA